MGYIHRRCKWGFLYLLMPSSAVSVMGHQAAAVCLGRNTLFYTGRNAV